MLRFHKEIITPSWQNPVKRKYPIIIIGMHRSGTSLVTKLLERLGLFVGSWKDDNHEALFFANLNTWLLRICGGRWDHPLVIRDLLENYQMKELIVARLTEMLRSPRLATFLGSKYRVGRTLHRLQEPWGWKDPRNTFTLPIWLQIFPQSKIIHVYRHGIDVASSLKVRAEKHLARYLQRPRWRKNLEFIQLRPVEPTDTIRCLSLEGGLSLWELYMAEAQRHRKQLGDMMLEIQYEDLIDRPELWLERLGSFTELDKAPSFHSRLSSAIPLLRGTSRYAYLRNPDLLNFARNHEGRLRTWGYKACSQLRH